MRLQADMILVFKFLFAMYDRKEGVCQNLKNTRTKYIIFKEKNRWINQLLP